ncbi:MAG: ABC transporter ATP-binding protein [Lachnospiraceae bacterium]|nr:ABC transporter ATP-binding protein [Lachnospiraceae bacterium]
MDEILKVEHVVKIYGNGVMANKDINFTANKGEIHAICGENGAGKSTLMKMLYGIEQPSEGSIYVKGRKVELTSSAKAIENSIGMVHQHFMLVPSLTVAENVVLGVEPKKGIKFDKKEAIRMTDEIAEKYNLPVPANEKVEDISVGMKQRVEIIKALLKGAEILILDEPTTVLTPQETEELFTELRHLRDEGHTILFISHKLYEVKKLCDKVSIMRNGKMLVTMDISEVSEADISRLMVGRDVVEEITKEKANPKGVVLEAKNISCMNYLGRKMLDQVSFKVRSGEILGMAGVEGNGQHEILEAIAGMQTVTSGTIQLEQKDITNQSIKNIRSYGVSHIPEDRMINGSAKNLSIMNNLLAGRQNSATFTNKILLKTGKIRETAQELIKEYKVKCSSENQEIGMLSGGNIQKVVVAREFDANPKLILVDQPSRGIDIGAATFIRERLIQLRDEGKAILLNSADLNEVLELSDSLMVFYGGQIVAYFEDTSVLTEEELGLYMLGLKKQSMEEIEERMNER